MVHRAAPARPAAARKASVGLKSRAPDLAGAIGSERGGEGTKRIGVPEADDAGDAPGRTPLALDRQPDLPHAGCFTPACCTRPSMRLPQGCGCNSSKPLASRTVSRPPAQAWTACGQHCKGDLASPHEPRCNYQRRSRRINRRIASPFSSVFPWRCTVAKTPPTLLLMLSILCLARPHEVLWPNLRSRNAPAYYGKRKRNSIVR